MNMSEPRLRTLLRQAEKTKNAGKRAAAAQLYREIVAEEPNLVEAWLGLGELSTDAAEKERAYRQALALDPENVVAQAGLACEPLPEVADTSEPETAVSPPPPAMTQQAPAVQKKTGAVSRKRGRLHSLLLPPPGARYFPALLQLQQTHLHRLRQQNARRLHLPGVPLQPRRKILFGDQGRLPVGFHRFLYFEFAGRFCGG